MMCRALEAFQEQHKVHFEKVTQIPLEGEGTINKRVEKWVTMSAPWLPGAVRDNTNNRSFLFIHLFADCIRICWRITNG
jgi:hypothetical protein